MIPAAQLLHFSDPLCLEFEAQIQERRSLSANRLGIVLDRSYFYPTGGGQEHDTGRLGEAQVTDVYKDEEGGVLVHVVDRPLAAGPVSASIDRARRLRHMQHHTAQHLLSHCCFQLLGLETVSANINGDTPSTLDLAGGEPGKDDLLRVETLANEIIAENRPVRAYFALPDRLKAIPLRKPPSVSEDIRIVEIDGLDYSACGGTHVSATGGIGVVKILRAERVKDRPRLHFIAGRRAVEYFQQLHEIISGLAGEMSVHLGELAPAVGRQAEQLKSAQRELSRLQAELLVAEAARLYAQAEAQGELRLALAAFSGRPMNELRSLAKELRLMPGVVAVLASEDTSSPPPHPVQVVIACAAGVRLQAQDLLRGVMAQVGGKGGGDASLAQGGGLLGPGGVSELLAAARALIFTANERI